MYKKKLFYKTSKIDKLKQLDLKLLVQYPKYDLLNIVVFGISIKKYKCQSDLIDFDNLVTLFL